MFRALLSVFWPGWNACARRSDLVYRPFPHFGGGRGKEEEEGIDDDSLLLDEKVAMRRGYIIINSTRRILFVLN